MNTTLAVSKNIMEASPQDLAKIGIGCCISSINSSPQAMLNMIEYDETYAAPLKKKQQQQISPRTRNRKPLRARMAPRLRLSSVDIMSSFTSGITDTIDEISDDNENKTPGPRRASVADCMSAADVARLVAQEYFEEESMHEMKMKTPELKSMPSLLDDSEDCTIDVSKHQDSARQQSASPAETVTTCSISRSELSQDEVIALEVGLSAAEYLEECFYTEVSVLNRGKFDAIPEINKSDFTIAGHLGKGSFSDVFEVVSNSGDFKKKEQQSSNVPGRRASRVRRTTFSSSINTATLTLSRRSQSCESRIVLAMKCLRPQIRSDPEQFTIGAEDLVHETAILANLKHRHIIKLHGRAPGSLTDAFVLNDGYFILLDKLKETLQERMESWKSHPKCLNPMIVHQGPTGKQIEVAHSIADAVTYLHSKNIVFRDLKPANVGFDSNGVLKLFDFGFAAGMPEPDVNNQSGELYERCGTPRYMAPEVGLSLGYGLPADVYSFGILLWEMSSLSKPFSSIKTSKEFDRAVFIGGTRPKIESYWPSFLGEIMNKCWSSNPIKRPTMFEVRSTLSYVMSNGADNGGGGVRRPPTIRARRRSVIGW